MTIHLTTLPMWTGETVAVLGNAPSLAAELATLVRPIHAIAVNRAAVVAPWADMMVSIDANWGAAAEDFAGVRIVGFEGNLDAHFLRMPHEVVTMSPNFELHIRSNLLAAIRVAAQAGAAKILLLGIDTEYYEAKLDAPGMVKGLAALIAEMAARGVEVVRYVAPVGAAAAVVSTSKLKVD